MPTSTRERRDWTLLIFIIPIGIILMLIAGQIAIRLVSTWSINAGMQSNLDPNNLPMQQYALVQPLLPGILTPPGWLDTFLTPMPTNIYAVTKTAIPSTAIPPTAIPPTAVPPTAIPPTAVPPTVIYSTAIPRTAIPPTAIPPTAIPPTAIPPTAIPPTAIPPTAIPPTAIPPTAIPPTAIPPTAIPPTPTGYPSTPPGGGLVPPPPNVVGPPDWTIAEIAPGSYTVIPLPAPGVIIVGPSETSYDLVYYESEFNGHGNSGLIYLDSVILGISKSADGNPYYDVFNWTSTGSHANTNISGYAYLDNLVIPMTALYPQPAGGTGIAIEADNAASQPPPGTYGYLVLICPTGMPQSLQVDSIEILP